MGVNLNPTLAMLVPGTRNIKEHNYKAEVNISHPKPIYREPSLLVIICANAPIAYTTENGVHVIPVGCLKD